MHTFFYDEEEICCMRRPGMVHGDRIYTARTSIWMFPIYGMACFLTPLCRLLRKRNFLVRGMVYTCCIFTGEFLSGSLLKRHGACPWDYSHAKYNINGVIRLDYAPLWFGAGLLFEKVVSPHSS